jgi:hypothetical protein
VNLGDGAGPYNYGSMTGNDLTYLPPSGSWTVVYDSGVSGQKWGRLKWTDSTPSDSSLIVYVSSSSDDSSYSRSETVTKSTDLKVPNGQYLRIRVLFKRAFTGETPVLEELEILG